MNTNPLNNRIIVGKQFTSGTPWRIRMTNELCARFIEEALKDYVPILGAIRMLGASRPSVLQRVKLRQLKALHVCRNRRKGLHIKVLNDQQSLFDTHLLKGV
jgi:hypothetical protein